MIASAMHTTERRTKILATVGPASDSERVLRGMIEAGMDAVRLNLSHGTLEEALAVHQRVRTLAAELDRPVGTLVDLPARRSAPPASGVTASCSRTASASAWSPGRRARPTR